MTMFKSKSKIKIKKRLIPSDSQYANYEGLTEKERTFLLKNVAPEGTTFRNKFTKTKVNHKRARQKALLNISPVKMDLTTVAHIVEPTLLESDQLLSHFSTDEIKNDYILQDIKKIKTWLVGYMDLHYEGIFYSRESLKERGLPRATFDRICGNPEDSTPDEYGFDYIAEQQNIYHFILFLNETLKKILNMKKQYLSIKEDIKDIEKKHIKK